MAARRLDKGLKLLSDTNKKTVNDEELVSLSKAPRKTPQYNKESFNQSVDIESYRADYQCHKEFCIHQSKVEANHEAKPPDRNEKNPIKLPSSALNYYQVTKCSKACHTFTWQ